MYKVRKAPRKVKVKGKPAKYGYEFRQLKPEQVNGKKTKGWNLTRSKYKVVLTLAYLIVKSPQGGKVVKFQHKFEVKDVVFNHNQVPRAEWLENRVHNIIADSLGIWQAQDLDEFNDDDLVVRAEAYPKYNKLTVTRMG